MSKWTTTKLITIASLGILSVLASIPGNFLVVVTGIIGIGGIITGFIVPMLFVFCVLLIRKFGAATLMGFILGVASLPLPNLGPPGFFPKILIGLVMGLTTDTIYHILRRREKIAAIFTALVAMYLSGLLLTLFIWLFKLPGFEEFLSLLPKLLIAALPMGLFAGYVGYLIYKKLENTAVVRRIQA